MEQHIDSEWHDMLQKMPEDEKRAFLQAVMRLRVHCPQCPVATPRLYLEPCYSCTKLPGDLGRPMSTVN